MKVIIIEDEPLAAEKLERYLEKCSKHVQVLKKLQTIRESIVWLLDHQREVDLIFLDIQLQDGLSFELFSRVEIRTPVIFTTAYDEYAIDAFKVNSIDYLLKPINFTALDKALLKYDSLRAQFSNTASMTPILGKLKDRVYKSRFLVKKGNHILSVPTKDVAYFYAEGRDVFLINNQGKKYIIDYKLEELTDFLESADFFRINRSLIVSISAILDVIVYSNRRLKLSLNPKSTKETIVARDRVASFKKWFQGE